MATNKALVDCLVLVAPSGAGKSTLLKLLQRDFPGRFGYSISHTTRDPRPGEVRGESYHYVTEDTFKDMIGKGEFLEHAVVHKTIYYGTSFKSLRDVASNDQVATMDLDIVGARSMRGNTIGLKSCIVFIQVPTPEILEQRLRSRNTESEEKIQVRLESAEKEMAWFLENRDFFDIELMNDDLDACYAKFRREVGRIIFGEQEEPKEGAKKDSSSSSSSAVAGGGGSPDAAADGRSDATTPHRNSGDGSDGACSSGDKSTIPADGSLGRVSGGSADGMSDNSGGDSSVSKKQQPAMVQGDGEENDHHDVARPLVDSLENGGAPRVRVRGN